MNPWRNIILVGDATERLRALPTDFVDSTVTSPPYFQLRDYGVTGQLGLEETVEAWVEGLREVMGEVARVLKPTGSLWLNVGDSYSRHERYGISPKGMLLGPERLLLALAADGWIVRNKVIWHKANPMPTSVTDRLNTTYEVVYLLVRSQRYYFDLDAIRESHRSRGGRRSGGAAPATRPAWAGPLAGTQSGLRRARPAGQPGHPLGKNPGDVWQLPTAGFRGAHFATFPESLVERPLLSTCPERICTACGRPWRRPMTVRQLSVASASSPHRSVREVGELEPTCRCGAATIPGVVLDPFFGAGTVGVVAARHRRDWVGIELNREYAEMARERLRRAGNSVDQRVTPQVMAA